MAGMTRARFVKKCAKIQLQGSTTAQSHFSGVCALAGYKTPLEQKSTQLHVSKSRTIHE
jgi:hypothetical protein